MKEKVVSTGENQMSIENPQPRLDVHYFNAELIHQIPGPHMTLVECSRQDETNIHGM